MLDYPASPGTLARVVVFEPVQLSSSSVLPSPQYSTHLSMQGWGASYSFIRRRFPRLALFGHVPWRNGILRAQFSPLYAQAADDHGADGFKVREHRAVVGGADTLFERLRPAPRCFFFGCSSSFPTPWQARCLLFGTIYETITRPRSTRSLM